MAPLARDQFSAGIVLIRHPSGSRASGRKQCPFPHLHFDEVTLKTASIRKAKVCNSLAAIKETNNIVKDIDFPIRLLGDTHAVA